MPASQCIAFYGGTFDPPHNAHIAVARAAADAFHLDQVLFAPTANQPLKPNHTQTTYEDRLAMVTLACHADTRFATSTLDQPLPGHTPNYTIDTLITLRDQHPDATLYNLVGADSFLDLPRWKSPKKLLEITQWIVVSRPGFSLDDLSQLHLTPAQLQQVHILNSLQFDLSATQLREALHNEVAAAKFLPQPVLEYIRSHHLYA